MNRGKHCIEANSLQVLAWMDRKSIARTSHCLPSKSVFEPAPKNSTEAKDSSLFVDLIQMSTPLKTTCCCFWEFRVTSPRDEASKIVGATFLVRRLLLQEILQYNSNSPQRTSAMPPSWKHRRKIDHSKIPLWHRYLKIAQVRYAIHLLKSVLGLSQRHVLRHSCHAEPCPSRRGRSTLPFPSFGRGGRGVNAKKNQPVT